jgi:hypothetical protein
MDMPATLINHSCEANAGILDNEYGAYNFYAIKKIKTGDELTWDYGCAEYARLSCNDCFENC